ncbi:MAG TPA: MFS transporter [Candidatus Paceibacterota bacterium]
MFSGLLKRIQTKPVRIYYTFSFFREFMFFSGVLVPFFTEWGHLSLTQIQILQSWFMLWIFILEVPTGAIADYLGRKYSIFIGVLIDIVGVLVYVSTPEFGVFLLGEFLMAVAMALVSGADQALLYDTLRQNGREPESKKVFGRAHSFKLSGMLIAAPIGSIIAQYLGMTAPMYLSTIPLFLTAICVWLMPEPKNIEHQSESKRYLDVVKKGFSFFRQHPTLKIIAMDAVAIASVGYFVIWLYQPTAQSVGIPIIYFGFIHSLFVLAEILIASNFAKLEKIFKSSLNYVKFSSFITGAMFVLVAIWPSKASVILFTVLAGGFSLTRMEFVSAHMNKLIPSAERATVLSAISMLRRIALVVLNPIVGFMADYSLYLTLGLLGGLTFVVTIFSPIKKEMLD